jgi:hypothetical protein
MSPVQQKSTEASFVEIATDYAISNQHGGQVSLKHRDH